MSNTGSYCKAYLARDLRAFEGWTEKPIARPPAHDDAVAEGEPAGIDDDTILYLHDTHVVTLNALSEDNVVFDAVTPAWTAFCASELQFEVPTYP